MLEYPMHHKEIGQVLEGSECSKWELWCGKVIQGVRTKYPPSNIRKRTDAISSLKVTRAKLGNNLGHPLYTSSFDASIP